jgi:hypothetical protein
MRCSRSQRRVRARRHDRNSDLGEGAAESSAQPPSAKHLALEPLQAMNQPCGRTLTPGQGPAGLDGGVLCHGSMGRLSFGSSLGKEVALKPRRGSRDHGAQPSGRKSSSRICTRLHGQASGKAARGRPVSFARASGRVDRPTIDVGPDSRVSSDFPQADRRSRPAPAAACRAISVHTVAAAGVGRPTSAGVSTGVPADA